MGRPSEFSQEVADHICEAIANGESLRSICLDEGMPSKSTVFRWLADDRYEAFRDHYARSRAEQAHLYAEQVVEIADEEVTMIRADKHKPGADDDAEIEVVFDSAAVARNRLRVDARKWVACKLLPRVYGEKQAIEHSGPDGKPIEHTHTVSAATRGLLEKLSGIGADSGPTTPVQD